MASELTKIPELLPDILQLVFQQLAGDNETLLNVSLTCRAWRWLAWPAVYSAVDLSSHNNGRQAQHEMECRPIVYADHHSEFRPLNLVPRQRAFLRLMVGKPHLARLVKSLTWTLVWLDFEEETLTDIDRQTWQVFSKMVNVTRLDLASLHDFIDDDYVRQNPPSLFPKTKDLKLLGWMHRGLVRSILTSLDPSKLQSLELNYLEDEGQHPNGKPMSYDFAERNSHSARSKRTTGYPSPNTTSSSEIYQPGEITLQETSKTPIFPGPSILPLHILLRPLHNHPSPLPLLPSLTHLQIKLPPFDTHTDLRNTHTMAAQTAAIMTATHAHLESLVVVFEENAHMYPDPRPRDPNRRICGTARVQMQAFSQPWGLKMTKLFLEMVLGALKGGRGSSPRLRVLRFEGFRCLSVADEWLKARVGGLDEGFFREVGEVEGLFEGASLVDVACVRGRSGFVGHDC